MRYKAFLEYDQASRHYTGTVAALAVIVDARSRAEAVRDLKKGIALQLEEAPFQRRSTDLRPEPGAETIFIDL